MKRKIIDVPQQLVHNPSVLNDLEELIQEIKSGKRRVSRTPLSEVVIPLVFQQTLDRHAYLNIPFDILKRIFLCLEDPTLIWLTARGLNRAFRDWVDGMLDRYRIEWKYMLTGPLYCNRMQDYIVWKDAPMPLVLTFNKKLNLKFQRFRDGKSHFIVKKRGTIIASSDWVINHRGVERSPVYETLSLDNPVIRIFWETKRKKRIRGLDQASPQNNFHSMTVAIKEQWGGVQIK